MGSYAKELACVVVGWVGTCGGECEAGMGGLGRQGRSAAGGDGETK